MIEFFDRDGLAVAVSPDEQSLFLWDGRPAAFVDDGHVYAYSGHFIGWMSNGWLIDQDGRRLLFEFDANGGPAKPDRHTRRATGPRQKKPAKGAMQLAPGRPPAGTEWSDRKFADLI